MSGSISVFDNGVEILGLMFAEFWFSFKVFLV